MATTKIQLNTIEEAIEDIRQGKIIIVVDDEDRENEGDFLAAAEKVTPEMINFMATHGRGLICAPLTENRCKELGLNAMVNNNTDALETAFTVSVDLRGGGVTTGISASDRASTILALVNQNTKPHDLARPGHIFPLIAKQGVFSVDDAFDFDVLKPFESVCDYFLFDTKGKLPGGNGIAFDWKVLKNYPSTKPFFLSGGIGLDEMDAINEILKTHLPVYAIDINSKFEIEPGLKNIQLCRDALQCVSTKK